MPPEASEFEPALVVAITRIASTLAMFGFCVLTRFHLQYHDHAQKKDDNEIKYGGYK